MCHRIAECELFTETWSAASNLPCQLDVPALQIRAESLRAARQSMTAGQFTDPLSIPEIPRQAGGALLRREYALIYRAGLLDKTVPFEVTLRYKSNNFSHFTLQLNSPEISRQ